MLYPQVEGHALLPAGLEGETLRQQVAVAERVLKFRGLDIPVLTGTEADDAARAIAMQVALQTAVDPDSYLHTSVGRGAETVSYRTDPVTGQAVMVHPVSWALREQLFEELEDEAGEPETATVWPHMGGWRQPSGRPL